MIKPSELKLNNLVLYNGEEYVITGLLITEARLKAATSKNYATVHYEDLSGIPITEERLIKDGWKYFHEDKWSNGKALIQIRDEKYFMGFGDDREWYIMPIEIKFFHQLQNLTDILK